MKSTKEASHKASINLGGLFDLTVKMGINRTGILFLLPALLVCCADESTDAVTAEKPLDTPLAVREVAETGDPCVFDTSTYQFTTEPLLRYAPDLEYRWDTATKTAHALLKNGDSLVLHIGGCDHFGFQASLLTSISFADTTALLEKAGWLARTFFSHGFGEKIPELIAGGHIRRVSGTGNETTIHYTFEDPDDAETNRVLDGFLFEKRGNKTFIDLSAYIN